VRLGLGLAAGAVLAAVDNVLFEGEVSPIVIVALLLAVTATAGVMWGRRAGVAVIAAWTWLPAAHLVKRFAGLPDTLHPNTYTSILMLAAFSLAVAVVGWGCGLLVRRLASGTPKPA
jgi:hypothetical protein